MKLFKSKWGIWQDLAIGKYSEHYYLLQGRRHKDGRVQFRVVKSDFILCSPAIELDQLCKL